MGTDAGFFAKKAKRYFWFDRLYNIHQYMNLSGDLMDLVQIQNKLENDRNATAAECIKLLEANIKAWGLVSEDEKERAEHRAGWCRDSIEFVKAFPDDEFFVASDNGDAYDLMGDSNGHKYDHGEYMEWTKELVDEPVYPSLPTSIPWYIKIILNFIPTISNNYGGTVIKHKKLFGVSYIIRIDGLNNEEI
jgi:hypothetical protein